MSEEQPKTPEQIAAEKAESEERHATTRISVHGFLCGGEKVAYNLTQDERELLFRLDATLARLCELPPLAANDTEDGWRADLVNLYNRILARPGLRDRNGRDPERRGVSYHEKFIRVV